jgi:hypothetical protein
MTSANVRAFISGEIFEERHAMSHVLQEVAWWLLALAPFI